MAQTFEFDSISSDSFSFQYLAYHTKYPTLYSSKQHLYHAGRPTMGHWTETIVNSSKNELDFPLGFFCQNRIKSLKNQAWLQGDDENKRWSEWVLKLLRDFYEVFTVKSWVKLNLTHDFWIN